MHDVVAIDGAEIQLLDERQRVHQAHAAGREIGADEQAFGAELVDQVARVVRN